MDLNSKHKVTHFLSDNEGEYKNYPMNEICNQRRIEQLFMIPYNPQQNDVVERMNWELIKMTCCIKHDTNLEKSDWREALAHASHLQNCLINSNISKKKTSLAIWINHKMSTN